MKPGQGVSQAGWGQVAQERLEQPQGVTHLPGVLQVPDDLQGLGIFDKAEGPPEGAPRVEPVVGAVPGGQRPGHLPAAARARGDFCQPPPQVPCTGAEVGQYLLRPAKHPGVEALQDKMRLNGRLPIPKLDAAPRHQEGVMDVALAIGLNLEDLPRLGKLPRLR